MKVKTVKVALEGFGSYLGMEKGCFIVKDKQGNTDRYPLFENLIDEIRVKSGNLVSSGVLASCGFWGIDCDFVNALNQYFQSKIRMPRVRMGEQQEIETLINEEALLFAMYLRNEKQTWKPRIAVLRV